MPNRPIQTTVEQSEQSLVYPFTEEEYRKGIATLNNNKAEGIYDVLVEQLKHLGPRAHRWLHSMLNTCFTEKKIPKVWRQSRIIAILKPGKEASIPKTHYNQNHSNRWITPNKGGSRLQTCTSQLLNLTQHIEDGYKNRMITVAAFVDLSASYDTVNHRIVIHKIFNTTRDSPLCRVIQNMLSSRRFYAELNNERSRWRKQKKGSVLSPVLCNIYTNDQPIFPGTRRCIYADDLCVAVQHPYFTEVEETIEDALEEITQYYISNSLQANPDKTQVTEFNLRNKGEKYR